MSSPNPDDEDVLPTYGEFAAEFRAHAPAHLAARPDAYYTMLAEFLGRDASEALADVDGDGYLRHGRGRKRRRDEADEPCPECGAYRVQDHRVGDLICTHCGLVQPFPILQDLVPSYRKQNYKPMFYRHERLVQYHMGERAVPRDIMDQVAYYMRVRLRRPNLRGPHLKSEIQAALRVINATRPEYRVDHRGRTVRRRTGTQYLENWLQIEYRLSGRHPPEVDFATAEWLDVAAAHVTVAFAPIRAELSDLPPSRRRKSEMCFNYVTSRLFELRGQPERGVYFPPLKSRDKLKKHDEWWWRICAYLGYTFTAGYPDPLWLRLEYAALPFDGEPLDGEGGGD